MSPYIFFFFLNFGIYEKLRQPRIFEFLRYCPSTGSFGFNPDTDILLTNPVSLSVVYWFFISLERECAECLFLSMCMFL